MMIALLRTGLHRSLLALGIAPHSSWQDAVLALVFKSGPLTRWSNWRRCLVAYFPHVDFARPRISDLIRVPLQLLWLCVVRRDPRDTGFFVRRRSFASRHAAWVADGIHYIANRLVPLQARAFVTSAIARLAAVFFKDRVTMQGGVDRLIRHAVWNYPAVRYGTYLAAALLAVLCVTTPFSIASQCVFVVLLLAVALFIRRIPGPTATLLLIVLSVTASTRYLWWRIAYTLNWNDSLDLAWGVLLLCAEIYTWLILILGYLQTSWLLQRTPKPMPADLALWPTVDIFIPTYNEPLKVVMATVYAALGIDWPREKLAIYLLDDGRREEFRQFARSAGVGYIVRPDNRHAKAGNLNHALTKTGGEYIAIFDCDHIPTRSFLQATMGWFAGDPKLALLQTPHHFFSPDPFERNLGLFGKMPNEGELFYGVIQDGNDLWNATFFCGSCAIIKRAPLESIGGIAVETVTEDAHTALKLQRLGFTSAYINLPQAAGLATESLSAHIGQRIRWARGMAQIFRLDNPFFGKGLTWMQRICYGNAMLHFFNGAPRLIFLTAPLAFLLFHAYVIYTPAIAVVLYVLPHMAHANITNSRIQGGHRHSFWAEVYETVLAWYIVRPTTVALLNPHRGKFNVTAKGGLVEKSYFDWSISTPYLVIIALNLLGFVVGIGRIIWGPADEIPTTLLNLAWTAYNILLLGAAISVASEARQVRQSHRIALRLAAILHLPGGHLIRCHTENFSEGGAAILATGAPNLTPGQAVTVTLWRGEEEYAFPARVVEQSGVRLQISWALQDAAQQMALIQCTFSRADAWARHLDRCDRDVPIAALRRVVMTGIEGYRRVANHAAPTLPRFVSRTSSMIDWTASLFPRPPNFQRVPAGLASFASHHG